MSPTERALGAIVAVDCTANPSACLAAVRHLEAAGDLEAAAAAMALWAAAEELSDYREAA